VLKLMQSVATYQNVTIDNLQINTNLDTDCMKFLEKQYSRNRSSQKFYNQVTKFMNSHSSSLCNFQISKAKEVDSTKSIHPKLNSYLEYLTKKGISTMTQRNRLSC